MIDKLTLQNFQSHRQTELEFDPGLNVIIGPSDSGKTAIIRALRWLAWNRPLGNAFCSNWGGETNVSVITDATEITRIEGKEKAYLLNESVFKAFGTEVPEEIQQALNLSEINLQSQLDAPFLLSKSAGEIAVHFNQIAKLDKIDTGLKNITSWLKDVSRTIDNQNESIKQIQTSLESYNYIDKMESDIEVLETMDNKLNQLDKTVYNLQRFVEKIKTTDEKIENESRLLPLFPLVLKTLSLIEEKRKIEIEGNKLQRLINTISQTNNEIKEKQQLLKLSDLTDKILIQIQNKGIILKQIDRLILAIENIVSTGKKIERLTVEMKNDEKLFHDNFPDLCPLCGK